MAEDFGEDIGGVSDLTEDGRTVTGNRLVGEAVARRWSTPRGRLIGYPEYGFDLTQYVNADMSARDIAGLRGAAAAEAEKDERVESCIVTAELADGVLTVTGQITTAIGPFILTVAVSDVTLTLLEVT